MQVNKTIAEKAESFIGENEIPPNAGFENKIFTHLMMRMGWMKGYAWCVIFCRLCWFLAGEKRYTLLKPSVIKTLRSMKAEGYELELVPQVGAIAIYRKFKNGKPLTPGHACIVISVDENNFHTIDGNTSKQNETEGTTVAYRTRSYKWKIDDGYRLLGFYNPIQ